MQRCDHKALFGEVVSHICAETILTVPLPVHSHSNFPAGRWNREERAGVCPCCEMSMLGLGPSTKFGYRLLD